MKVTAILSSPRKQSNSSKLADVALKAAEKNGYEVKRFNLNDLEYKACQACMKCKTGSEICVLNDDLKPVLKAAAEADFLILASPVYIGDINAQMKGFIDRTYSYFVPDFAVNPHPSRLKGHKKMLFIITQGVSNKEAYEDSIIGHYDNYFQAHGFEMSSLIAPALGKSGLSGHSELLQQASEFFD